MSPKPWSTSNMEGFQVLQSADGNWYAYYGGTRFPVSLEAMRRVAAEFGESIELLVERAETARKTYYRENADYHRREAARLEEQTREPDPRKEREERKS